ncbi:MAG: tetratricopeptide repeat protein [Spirochaetes bacterium]|nr:tetratricopeptide repeat protein [Spirochaetota bacterium]
MAISRPNYTRLLSTVAALAVLAACAGTAWRFSFKHAGFALAKEINGQAYAVEKLRDQYRGELERGDMNAALYTLRKLLERAREKHGVDSPEAAAHLGELGSLCTRMGLYDRALEYHSAALTIRLKIQGERHPDTAAAFSNVGLARYHSGDYGAAVENYRRALDIYRTSPPANTMAVAAVGFNLGRALDALGDGDGAVERIREAIAVTEKTDPRNAGFLGLCYNGLGSAYRAVGKYRLAAEQYEKTLGLLRERGEDAPTLAEADAGMGFVLYHLGEYPRAVEHYEKARAYYVTAYGRDHLYSAHVYQPMGDVLRAMGKFDRAIELFNLTLGIYERAYGEAHQHTAGVYINLGEVYRALGDTDRAVEYHAMALGIYKRSLGEKHVHTATALMYLGGAYKSRGSYSEAINAYSEAAAIYRGSLGEGHSYIGTAYTNLGGACEPAGDYDRALEFYRKALPIYLRTFGGQHPHTATLYNNLGLVHFKKGEYAPSMENYRKALNIYGATLGEAHPYVGIALTNMGLAAAGLGDNDTAMGNYRKAEAVFEKNRYRAELITLKENMASLRLSAGDTDGAAGLYRSAVDLVMKYRLELGRQKTGFMSRHLQAFTRLAEIEHKRGRLNEAFRIDCMRKGLSVTEGLTLKEALAGAVISAEDRKKLLAVDAALEDMQSSYAVLMNEKNSGTDKKLREIWRAEKEKEKTLDELVKKYPVFAGMVRPKIPSAGDIASALEGEEILISFSLEEGRCLAFVLEPRKSLQTFIAGAEGEGAQGRLDADVRNFNTLCKRPLALKGYRKIVMPEGGLILIDERDNDPLIVIDGGKVYRLTGKGKEAFEIGGAPERLLLGHLEGSMSADEARTYRDLLAKKLYRELLFPALGASGAGKKLVIVPDGILYYLPFGYLKKENGSTLLEHHTVTLVHSPSVWYGLGTHRHQKGRHPLLAFGNAVYAEGHGKENGPATERRIRSSGTLPRLAAAGPEGVDGETLKRRSFANLPGTGDEIRAVMEMAYKNPAERRRHSREGVEANEDMLANMGSRDELKRYRVLHFAAHGLFVDDAPALNALVFTLPDVAARVKQDEYGRYVRTNGALKRDGFLRLGEIRALGLENDLVVLSACETSIGSLAPGEGMVALPQSFLLAGSRCVMASLWAVDDEATNLLMKEFYHHYLGNGVSPAEALRRAQMALSAEFEEPGYWAAFAVYGR